MKEIASWNEGDWIGAIAATALFAVLVIGGLFFDLPLPLAVIGHEGGTVLVVLNGLRLLGAPIRPGRTKTPSQTGTSLLEGSSRPAGSQPYWRKVPRRAG